MQFTRISQHDGEVTLWLSGVYKVKTYGNSEFQAYYLREGDRNWGWNVAAPPCTNQAGGYKFWPSLGSAQSACEAHALIHAPKSATVRRAAEVMQHLLGEEATDARQAA